MEGLADILSVLIGLVFVYLVLSMIVSYLVEMYASLFEKRQEILANSIQLLMNPKAIALQSYKQVKAQIYPELNHDLKAKVETGAGLAVTLKPLIAKAVALFKKSDPDAEPYNLMYEFYKHPLIMSLSKPQHLPSYIEPELFSKVIIDLLQSKGEEDLKDKIFKRSERLESLKKYSLNQLQDYLQYTLKQACAAYITKCPPTLDELLDLLVPEIESLASSPELIKSILLFDFDKNKDSVAQLIKQLPEPLKGYSLESLQQLLIDNLKTASLNYLINGLSDEDLVNLLPKEMRLLENRRDILKNIISLDDNPLVNYSFAQIRQMLTDEKKKSQGNGSNLIHLLSQETRLQILATEDLDLVELGLCRVANSRCLREALKPYIMDARRITDSAEKRFTTFNGHITSWYKSAMDRANGWYTRETRVIAFVCSLVVAFMLNADTIEIMHNLYGNANMRNLVNNAASKFIESQQKGEGTSGMVAGNSTVVTPLPGTSASQTIPASGTQKVAVDPGEFNAVMTQVKSYANLIPMPLGWDSFKDSITDGAVKPIELPFVLLVKLGGLLATTLAISQGSSIWFQMLSKLINLRSSGVKPGETGSKAVQ